MVWPFGDHVGAISIARLSVSRRSSPPSAAARYISRLPVAVRGEGDPAAVGGPRRGEGLVVPDEFLAPPLIEEGEVERRGALAVRDVADGPAVGRPRGGDVEGAVRGHRALPVTVVVHQVDLLAPGRIPRRREGDPRLSHAEITAGLQEDVVGDPVREQPGGVWRRGVATGEDVFLGPNRVEPDFDYESPGSRHSLPGGERFPRPECRRRRTPTGSSRSHPPANRPARSHGSAAGPSVDAGVGDVVPDQRR